MNGGRLENNRNQISGGTLSVTEGRSRSRCYSKREIELRKYSYSWLEIEMTFIMEIKESWSAKLSLIVVVKTFLSHLLASKSTEMYCQEIWKKKLEKQCVAIEFNKQRGVSHIICQGRGSQNVKILIAVGSINKRWSLMY